MTLEAGCEAKSAASKLLGLLCKTCCGPGRQHQEQTKSKDGSVSEAESRNSDDEVVEQLQEEENSRSLVLLRQATNTSDASSTSTILEGSTSSEPPTTSKHQQPPAKNCYRLVLLGSSRVGKTALVSRFLHNRFSEAYTPTIEDFHRKLYKIRGDLYQLDILDTSGNHPFPAMRRLSFLTGDLFLLVYSVDSRESFEEALRLRDQIIETKLSVTTGGGSGGGGSSSGGGGGSGTGSGGGHGAVLLRRKTGLQSAAAKVPIVIVGNKCDKDMRELQSTSGIKTKPFTESNILHPPPAIMTAVGIEFTMASHRPMTAFQNDTRTVGSDEARSATWSTEGNNVGGGVGCGWMEASAKRNVGVSEAFQELFAQAQLPPEMAPHLHRALQHQQHNQQQTANHCSSPSPSPSSSPSPSRGGSSKLKGRMGGLSMKRRLSDATAVLATDARRPSLRTDLIIMRAKSKHGLLQLPISSAGSTSAAAAAAVAGGIGAAAAGGAAAATGTRGGTFLSPSGLRCILQ